MPSVIILKKTHLLLLVLCITSTLSNNDQEWSRPIKYDTNLDFDSTNEMENAKITAAEECDRGEFCSNIADGALMVPNNMKRKSNLIASSAFNSAEEFLQPNYLARIPKLHFQTSLSKACNCGMEHEMLDLGNNYIPRYISTAVCMGGGCWGTSLSCKPKQYKIRVLKRRQEEEEESKDFFQLPAIVREGWVLETITVTVACECKS